MLVVTSTPDLSAFLMLRRQSWFIPARTSASVRPASGTWKTYCGWPSANPSSVPCGRQPSEVSWETTRAPTGSRSVGGRSASLRTAGSASPSFTWAALQRRVTTGGPIRTPKAPCSLRYAVMGASQSPSRSVDQSRTGPSGR